MIFVILFNLCIELMIIKGKEPQEDPAWHCLTVRFHHIVSLLDLVASQLNTKAKIDSGIFTD